MPTSRLQHLTNIKSIVVKLGTGALTAASGQLDALFFSDLAGQVARLRSRGLLVTIVSSGAVGAGVTELKIGKRPSDLAKLQAVAAVGQRKLMDCWAAAFEPHGLHVAQLLLTREDIDHRRRFLNLRNTIHAVHELGGVPIINENDTVSTDEIVRISFGDNDILAALVAHALRADLLILLSVIDGIFDSTGQSVRLVESIDTAREWVRTEKSALGKGGMDSKLTAAEMVTDTGCAMIVAEARMPEVLLRAVEGDPVGTLFAPATKNRSARERWIRSARPAGVITVDAGAAAAVTQHNKSLLPAGVTAVTGEFSPGDVVGISGPDGRDIASGLSNYSSIDLEKIRGKRTAEVRAMLDESAYDEVVHRDNLVTRT